MLLCDAGLHVNVGRCFCVQKSVTRSCAVFFVVDIDNMPGVVGVFLPSLTLGRVHAASLSAWWSVLTHLLPLRLVPRLNAAAGGSTRPLSGRVNGLGGGTGAGWPARRTLHNQRLGIWSSVPGSGQQGARPPVWG